MGVVYIIPESYLLFICFHSFALRSRNHIIFFMLSIVVNNKSTNKISNFLSQN